MCKCLLLILDEHFEVSESLQRTVVERDLTFQRSYCDAQHLPQTEFQVKICVTEVEESQVKVCFSSLWLLLHENMKK